MIFQHDFPTPRLSTLARTTDESVWYVIDITSTCNASSTLFSNRANKRAAQSSREIDRIGAIIYFEHIRLTSLKYTTAP